MRLTYHDDSHRYYLDGKRCKSASAIAKRLEDGYRLDLWKQRQVAIGVASHPALVDRIAAHFDDKDALNAIVEEAHVHAKTHQAADRGTAMHRFTERADNNEAMLATELATATVHAWRTALDEAGLDVVDGWTETIVAYPDQLVCGRMDRIVRRRRDGRMFILDLKGLAVDTPLPTPTGWTTMGAVQVGDQVIGSDGKPCTVVAKSDRRWRDCYRITFDDSTSVIADDEHQWAVRSGSGRWAKDQVLTTTQIRDTLFRYGQRQHRVTNAAPIELPEADLPIEPYLLGCWLGDGSTRDGRITKPLPAMWAELARRGHLFGEEHKGNPGTRTVYGLGAMLRDAGLTHNKHVPAAYLRASRAQRLDLLRGLLDTDGSWNKPRRSIVFTSCDKQLAADVYELIVSLGWRALISEVEREGFGLTVTAYDVSFVFFGDMPLIAKADRVTRSDGTAVSRRRLIVSVEPVPSVATQCIAVDSPDHTYLCTEAMVPTHNTGAKALNYPHSIAVQLAVYANAPVAYRIDGQSGSSDVQLLLPAELDREVALVFAMPSPDEWSIVPVRIGRAWHVANTALFLALEWERADDLVLPAIVEHQAKTEIPVTTSSDPADDPFAGLDGVPAQAPPADAPIVDEVTTGASSGAPVEPAVVCRGCARPVAADAGVCATCHTIVPAAKTAEGEAGDREAPGDGAATVAAVEPAGTTSLSVPAYTTREWIIERVRQVAVLHPQALDALAAIWPAGVPSLASKAMLSPEQWKLVDRAVMEIEKRTDAPFIPGPRNHEQDGWVQRLSDAATAPREPVAPVAPAGPPEPADAPDHHVDAVCMLLSQLEQGQPAEWAQRRLVEAKDAGCGIAIRRVRSMRLVNIGYAIHAWARINDDRLTRLGMALLPDATFIDDRPLGVIFATLTDAQATMLRDIADGVSNGTWQYRCDDQGGERFVQAARA